MHFSPKIEKLTVSSESAQELSNEWLARDIGFY
jgi:hypothetical protein